jgi:hypothetical protein
VTPTTPYPVYRTSNFGDCPKCSKCSRNLECISGTLSRFWIEDTEGEKLRCLFNGKKKLAVHSGEYFAVATKYAAADDYVATMEVEVEGWR